jgi:PKHD-type hydroxylase
MQLKNNFWFFEKALSESFCNEIIKSGFDANPKLAKTHKYHNKKITSKNKKDLKKLRDSNVAFLDHPWIYKDIDQIFKAANHNARWNFQYDFYEATQFTVYEKNQHYGWHVDANVDPYSNNVYENYKGKIRKLSATIALNDAKDYKGGEFQIDLSTPTEKRLFKVPSLKKKGSIVIFPSHLQHRVTPVTKGVRYSLVIWALGLPWR